MPGGGSAWLGRLAGDDHYVSGATRQFFYQASYSTYFR